MTRALAFTEASLARAIKGARRAGLRVTGIRSDGSLIVGDNAAQDEPIRLGSSDEPRQPDPFVVAAERVGHGTAKGKRNGAPS